MQQSFTDESARSAVLDLICTQVAQETTRYVARIAAYRAVMRKHGASTPDACPTESPDDLDALLHEATALVRACARLRGNIRRSDSKRQA